MERSNLFTDDLKVLSAAFSEQIKTANRLWSFAATIALLVVAAKPDPDGNIPLLGFEVATSALYPCSLALLALVTISYCSHHLQAHHTITLFYASRDAYRAISNEFVPPYTYQEATDAMFHSQSHERIAPFARLLPKRFQGIFFRLAKLLVQLAYYSVPLAGCVYCAYRTLENVSTMGIQVLVVVALSFPLGATSIMMIAGLRWVKLAAPSFEVPPSPKQPVP